VLARFWGNSTSATSHPLSPLLRKDFKGKDTDPKCHSNISLKQRLMIQINYFKTKIIANTLNSTSISQNMAKYALPLEAERHNFLNPFNNMVTP